MADEKQITKEQLKTWVEKAYWSYLSEYTVPWVAAETAYGFELGLEWIDSREETIASAGWSTLAYYSAVNKDEDLDIEAYSKLNGSLYSLTIKDRKKSNPNQNGTVVELVIPLRLYE